MKLLELSANSHFHEAPALFQRMEQLGKHRNAVNQQSEGLVVRQIARRELWDGCGSRDGGEAPVQTGAEARDLPLRQTPGTKTSIETLQEVKNPRHDLLLVVACSVGSSVMPNAPWMTAADNVGLADHQYNNPLQSDLDYESDLLSPGG